MPKNAIIIGSGLSGMAMGIDLLQKGHSVLILEKQPFSGGVCRTIDDNGLKFEVGCNDFGVKIEDEMRRLGVNQTFTPVKHKMFFPGGKEIRLPFDIYSMWTLFYPVDLYRLHSAIRSSGPDATLESVTENLKNPEFRNMILGLASYFLFRPPSEISLNLAAKSMHNDFGYDDPRIPEGGVQSLVDNMVSRFRSLGGEIRYESECLSIENRGATKRVSVKSASGDQCTEEAEIVVSSVHGWNQLKTLGSRPSLSISALLFTMDKRFDYPDGMHTLIFLPSDVNNFLQSHEDKALVKEFGFHSFKKSPSKDDPEGRYAISVYFLSPRDMNEYSEKDKAQVQDYIIATIDKRLAGFRDAILNTAFYDPKQYRETFGFPGAVAPQLALPNTQIPHYDPDKGVYYIGNAVNAPSDQHAGGAFLSVRQVVDKIAPMTDQPTVHHHAGFFEQVLSIQFAPLLIAAMGIVLAVYACRRSDSDGSCLNFTSAVLNDLLKSRCSFWADQLESRPLHEGEELNDISLLSKNP